MYSLPPIKAIVIIPKWTAQPWFPKLIGLANIAL